MTFASTAIHTEIPPPPPPPNLNELLCSSLSDRYGITVYITCHGACITTTPRVFDGRADDADFMIL